MFGAFECFWLCRLGVRDLQCKIWISRAGTRAASGWHTPCLWQASILFLCLKCHSVPGCIGWHTHSGCPRMCRPHSQALEEKLQLVCVYVCVHVLTCAHCVYIMCAHRCVCVCFQVPGTISFSLGVWGLLPAVGITGSYHGTRASPNHKSQVHKIYLVKKYDLCVYIYICMYHIFDKIYMYIHIYTHMHGIYMLIPLI